MISDEICFSKKHKSVHKSVAIVALRSAKTPKKGAFQHKPEAAGKSLLHERYALQLEKNSLGPQKKLPQMQIIQVVYSHCLPFRSSTDRLPSDNLTCWAVIAASKPDALQIAKNHLGRKN